PETNGDESRRCATTSRAEAAADAAGDALLACALASPVRHLATPASPRCSSARSGARAATSPGNAARSDRKVKRHLVCKRWTIEKADENSNGIPWFVLHRPNSDKLRFHLPSLPWHWFDA